MDLQEKNADYHHFFNLFRLLFFSYIMLDKKFSREQLNRSIKAADRIRGYIQDAVMYLDQEEKEQIFSMLADRMKIRTEAKALLDKILSSKKSEWPGKN